jgi:hypothetical protein
VVPFHADPVGPFQHRPRDWLRAPGSSPGQAVVAYDHRRPVAAGDQRIQLPHDPGTADLSVDDERRRLSREIADHGKKTRRAHPAIL